MNVIVDACLKAVQEEIKPAKIYEMDYVYISENNWAVSAAIINGNDRRFRFTNGHLYDEAQISDTRVA